MLRLYRRGADGSSEPGQILVMFALGLIVFLGFAALTVDIGFLLVTHRSYQNSADSAALAGATYLTRPTGDPCADVSGGGSKHDCARAAAWNYLRNDLRLALTDAQINLLKASNTTAAGEVVSTTDGGDDYTIWVSTPPVDAGISSSMSTVRDSTQVLFVRVDRMRHTFVGGVLGLRDFNVSSWATAGIFPNRFAVITLRRGTGSTEIDPGPANTTDIKTAGTGSSLTVVDGDVGGNWGMKLTAGSRLNLVSTTTDDVRVLLIDYVSCGNSCWSSGQVQKSTNGGSFVATNPEKLPGFVADPNYAPPPIPGATFPNGPINNPAGTGLDIPNADDLDFVGGPPNVTINAGTVTSVGGCVGPDGTEATAPRLGPGTYGSITLRNNACVILDPRRWIDDFEDGMNGEASPGGAWDWIGSGQYPGIFYVTGQIDIRNSALIVGDGVTVMIRPNGGGPAQFSPGSGGAMNLNTGKVLELAGAQKLAGWTTQAKSPYLFNGTNWDYQASYEADLRLNGVGLALYILKPGQAGISDTNGTDVIAVNSGAALSWAGITYAPNDNVAIAGQPNHDGIGQLISYTFTFNGGTDVTQTFDGPGDGFPYLIEPCVIVSGACQ